MEEPLSAAMAENPRPAAGVLLFDQMMRDIMGGGNCADPMGQVLLVPCLVRMCNDACSRAFVEHVTTCLESLTWTMMDEQHTSVS